MQLACCWLVWLFACLKSLGGIGLLAACWRLVGGCLLGFENLNGSACWWV